MIAVDTNILIRFLVRDDEKQAEAVYRRLKQAEKNRERLFISMPVVLETIWVLESAYDRSRQDIVAAFRDLLQMSVFEFEKAPVVEKILEEGQDARADLSDVLIAHAARSCHCESGITFDRDAARIPFFRLLK